MMVSSSGDEATTEELTEAGPLVAGMLEDGMAEETAADEAEADGSTLDEATGLEAETSPLLDVGATAVDCCVELKMFDSTSSLEDGLGSAEEAVALERAADELAISEDAD